MALYPLGYSGPWIEMPGPYQTANTIARLHPEVWRRISRMMEYARIQGGIPLGVGTGWRKQPTGKPGFAPPGQSYHEGWIGTSAAVPDGIRDTNAMAADMVPASSWPWMDAQCERFGLISFQYVNGEPWHVQAAEIPRARPRAHPPPPLDTFALPPPLTGGTNPPPPAPPPPGTPQEGHHDVGTLVQCKDGTPAQNAAVFHYDGGALAWVTSEQQKTVAWITGTAVPPSGVLNNFGAAEIQDFISRGAYRGRVVPPGWVPGPGMAVLGQPVPPD